MKQKQELPKPLQMVKEFEKTFPRCWEYVENMRRDKGKGLPDWSDLCYIPLAGTAAILTNIYGKWSDYHFFSGLYSALASWRQYKEIYHFSPELRDMLFEQAEGGDFIIPIEILFRIPYPCIYIDISDDEKDDGYFVYFDHDMNTQGMELRFYRTSEEPAILFLPIKKGCSVFDGIREVSEETQRRANTKVNHEDEQQLCELISRLIQPILYICAENAEIDENPKQKQITRRPSAGTPPKDVYREIRKWDVGVKISKQIRSAKKTDEQSDTKDNTAKVSHYKKRPHARRGHWHHYWMGSEQRGDKRLIIKWVAPTFVNGNLSDTITTINEKSL